jgi:hypothetical protein
MRARNGTRVRRLLWITGGLAMLAVALFLVVPPVMMPVSYELNQTLRLRPSLADEYQQVTLADTPVLTAPPAEGASSARALVYFHGIAGREQPFIEAMRNHGRVYSPPHPGYYGLPGPTSGASMRQSAERIVAELLQRHENVVILGHSLGGHAAVAAAETHPGIERLVLFNTFDDVGDVCTQWLGPLCARVDGKLDSGALAHELEVPVTQFQSVNDEVIHVETGARLFTSIETTAPARFIPVPGNHVGFSMEQALTRIFGPGDSAGR